MSEKDVTEKILLDFADVFADIINVLIFHGEERVLPQDLVSTNTISSFKDDNSKLRWQERDVSKFWTKQGVYLSLFGIENQTASDDLMPARCLSYDGQSYKTQIVRIKSEKDPLHNLYPVVTIVLHFGDKQWDKSKSLCESLGAQLLPELRPFVNDYQPRIFDVAFLSDETLGLFKSDFGKVAQFFVDCRKYGERQVREIMDLKEITHVEAVMDLLSLFTNVPREQFTSDGKGGISVTSAVTGLQERFTSQGDKRMGALYLALRNAGRLAEFEKAIQDDELREKLLRELKII